LYNHYPTINMMGKLNAMAFLAVTGSTLAFVPHRLLSSRSMATLMPAATLEPKTMNSTSTTSMAPTTWDCDEEAQCLEVPACDEEKCRTSLDVRIHGEWFDLTGEFDEKMWQAEA
jgi:hypothetical protein